MNKIIKIGEGDFGCTAIVCFNIPNDEKHNILENGVSFWIHNSIFDCELKIMKNSDVGKQLQDKIKSGDDIVTINNFLDIVVINNLSTFEIIQNIKSISETQYEKGFREGAWNAQDKIKKALGI